MVTKKTAHAFIMFVLMLSELHADGWVEFMRRAMEMRRLVFTYQNEPKDHTFPAVYETRAGGTGNKLSNTFGIPS
jgi:hypothetical protein